MYLLLKAVLSEQSSTRAIRTVYVEIACWGHKIIYEDARRNGHTLSMIW